MPVRLQNAGTHIHSRQQCRMSPEKIVWNCHTKLNLLLLLCKNISAQRPAHECLQRLYSSVTKTRKPPSCPSIGEWINELCHIQTTGCKWNKRNERSSYKKPWRNIKCMLLSENAYIGFQLYAIQEKDKTVQSKKIELRGIPREG